MDESRISRLIEPLEEAIGGKDSKAKAGKKSDKTGKKDKTSKQGKK